MLGHTAVVNGKPIAKVYDDAAESLACQRNAMELYGHDGLVLHGWANAGGAEFGGEIEFPYRKYTGAPMMKKAPCRTRTTPGAFAVPDDITHRRHHAGSPRVLPPAVRGGMPVTVQVGSPLTWAGSVCGEERLMLWIIKKPDLVHHVLRVITDFILEEGRLLGRPSSGPRVSWPSISASRPTSSTPPSSSRPSASPTSKRSTITSPAGGRRIFLSHICGEQNKNLPLWSQLTFGKRGMISVGKEVPSQVASESFPDLRHHGQRRPGDRAGGHPGPGARSLPGLHRGGQGPSRAATRS